MSWLNKPLHLDKVASYTWQILQINPSSFSPWTPSSWTYLPVQQSHTARWLVLLVFCLFSASHTLSLVRNLLASQLLLTYSIPMTDPRVIKEKTWHILNFPTGVKREQRPHKLSYNYWWNQFKKSLIPKYLLKLWPESHHGYQSINPTNQKQLLPMDRHQKVPCLDDSHTFPLADVDSVETVCFLSLVLHYNNVLGDGSVTQLLSACIAYVRPWVQASALSEKYKPNKIPKMFLL